MGYKKPVLAKDEASALAVFDPQDGHNLDELHEIVKTAPQMTEGEQLDTRLAAILTTGESYAAQASPWTLPPRHADRVLVLRLRQHREGNVAPWVRQTAIASGLAVLDLSTDLVFASPAIQAQFDLPTWRGDQHHAGGADWMQVGCFLLHSTFGEGRVLDIGTYKKRRVFVAQFKDIVKVLDMEYGLPHVHPIPPPTR